MNWDNYGSYWELDHVKPCSLFNFTIKNERLECLHWMNTRPLEKRKNLHKRNKYNTTIQHLHNIVIKSFTIKN